jgi:hypothetical protein
VDELFEEGDFIVECGKLRMGEFVFIRHGDIINHKKRILVVNLRVKLIKRKEIKVIKNPFGEVLLIIMMTHGELKEGLIGEVEVLVDGVEGGLAGGGRAEEVDAGGRF